MVERSVDGDGDLRSTETERFGFPYGEVDRAGRDVGYGAPSVANGAIAPYERAAPRTGLDHPIAFKLAVNAGDSVGINGQLQGQRLDGRQLLARSQRPERDGPLHLLDELQVKRDPAARIDRKDGGHELELDAPTTEEPSFSGYRDDRNGRTLRHRGCEVTLDDHVRLLLAFVGRDPKNPPPLLS